MYRPFPDGRHNTAACKFSRIYRAKKSPDKNKLQMARVHLPRKR